MKYLIIDYKTAKFLTLEPFESFEMAEAYLNENVDPDFYDDFVIVNECKWSDSHVLIDGYSYTKEAPCSKK